MRLHKRRELIEMNGPEYYYDDIADDNKSFGWLDSDDNYDDHDDESDNCEHSDDFQNSFPPLESL